MQTLSGPSREKRHNLKNFYRGFYSGAPFQAQPDSRNGVDNYVWILSNPHLVKARFNKYVPLLVALFESGAIMQRHKNLVKKIIFSLCEIVSFGVCHCTREIPSVVIPSLIAMGMRMFDDFGDSQFAELQKNNMKQPISCCIETPRANNHVHGGPVIRLTPFRWHEVWRAGVSRSQFKNLRGN